MTTSLPFRATLPFSVDGEQHVLPVTATFVDPATQLTFAVDLTDFTDVIEGGLAQQGQRLANWSITLDANGNVGVAALYRQLPGAWSSTGWLSASDYQTTFNQQMSAGMTLEDLAVVNIVGSPTFWANWSSQQYGSWTARHNNGHTRLPRPVDGVGQGGPVDPCADRLHERQHPHYGGLCGA